MKNDSLKDQYRINERIRVREVRLVGDNVEQGVYPIFQALKIAEEQGLDLVEISPNAEPPVCRVIDYQKFLYQQKKRQKEQKAKSVKIVVKEIRFTATTDKHDLETKAKASIKFLQDGMKVKVAVFIKGRMMQRMDIVKQTLTYFLDLVKDYSVIEKQPELLGKDYYVVLNPKK